MVDGPVFVVSFCKWASPTGQLARTQVIQPDLSHEPCTLESATLKAPTWKKIKTAGHFNQVFTVSLKNPTSSSHEAPTLESAKTS